MLQFNPKSLLNFKPSPKFSFIKNPLNRTIEVRTEEFLKNSYQNPSAKLILFDSHERPLLQKNANHFSIALLPLIDAKKNFSSLLELDENTHFIYLGDLQNIPYYCCELKTSSWPSFLEKGENSFVNLRGISQNLSVEDSSILAQAKTLLYFHKNNQYCASCGKKSNLKYGGSQRVCKPCEKTHYPRIEPAMITLVHFQDKILLARQKSWEKGRYSTFAGFAESAESLESNVIRELREEANVEIEQIHYFHSQPHPFPHSLMVGFFAKSKSLHFRINEHELETGRWFQFEEVKKLLDGQLEGYSLPSTSAISYQLIDFWANNLTKEKLE